MGKEVPSPENFSHVGLPAAVVWPQRHPALLVHLYGGAILRYQPDVHDQKPCQADKESQVYHKAHKYGDRPAAKSSVSRLLRCVTF